MIDIAWLRKNLEHGTALLKKKDPAFPIDTLLSLDNDLRSIRLDVEQLRHKKNELASQAKSGITAELREQSIAIGKELKSQEVALEAADQKFRDLYLSCPNIPQEDVPVGGKEANRVVKEVGEKATFDFPVKNHLELGNALGWFDFERATVIAGSNFPLYKGEAVKLLYSMMLFMLKNNIRHGYEPILPPVVVNETSLEVAGNFPKFRDQVYAMPEDNLYLSPTAEVGLTNLYRGHIFAAQDLPVRMTGWTSCFRREAGGYGAHERGLIRIHQFEKVELVTMCEPEKSNQELDRMIACAEDILLALGLHYRISLLAGQDCSFQSAKTFDIEVWLPGQKQYYEVSSCSNCTDFQARRGLMRYRTAADEKPELVHTLNASSLALPRLMVALMETYQQPDGTIALPDVLKQNWLF